MAQADLEKPPSTETVGDQIAGLRARLKRIAKAVNGAFGVPDYDRYVRDFSARHPDQTPLTRKEFEEDRLRNRYEKPGNRCP
jgi:uncharacterized short protein YbdD (DUF466 family)